jgi:hypothetical protein
MDLRELAEEYQGKSDGELLQLALKPEQLTTEANEALRSELARRRIDSPDCLDNARRAEQERNAENDRDIGPLGFFPYGGFGRMRFGKSGRVYDADSGSERFTTTVFILIFFFPLIPTGSYLVQRDREWPNKLAVLEKLPLDWEQVLSVWVVAAGSVAAFLWALRFLRSCDAVSAFARRLLS